ncbi:molybdopterin-containing oxidoreductase family protein [Caldinitratiruptor microaerophilus]|uniref:Formate dehydrogenase n=1 Tax=Caldinitratiruptor microaerophilus TaxID=671077 RepID=A0AA35CLB5_9FIRM|nr:molybdopterin-dependent oxidoreductase [Caldinitratiruptor microaerophilus]BDG60518.1 formate dehydrogenase [Caldinitratiruptor microaerophilus]
MPLAQVTRRQFLKISAATSGALAAGLAVPGFDSWRTAAAAEAEEERIPTICEMCGVKCGVIAVVRGGRVVRLEGNPDHPLSRGRLCARGNAGMMSLYDPDRLREPLKRNPDGSFVPISWDQAIAEIGEKLKSIRERYGPEALVFAVHPELIAPWEKRFCDAFGTPNFSSHAPTCYSHRTAAYVATYGALPAVDYANVRYLISPGRNHLGGVKNNDLQKLAQAKAAGAKFVVLDPRYSEFAAWATEWLPIRPGTDGAFLLALMNVLVEEDLYDRDFVAARTAGFAELREAVKQYTPEWAAGVTDVPAETIRRVARELAAARPAAAVDPCWHGGLGSMYYNGFQAARAAACLNALLGNLGAKGGLVFPASVKLGSIDDLGPKPPKPAAPRFDGAGGPRWPLAKDLGMIHTLPEAIETGKPYPIKAAIISHFNPVRSCPDSRRWLQALRKLELVVVIDVQMSDTATAADYVLPESHYLERSDPVWVTGDTVALRRPAVAPLHNTLPEDEILRRLAEAVGIGEYFTFTLEEYNDALLRPLGLTTADLEKAGVVRVPVQPPNYDRLKTPSGKVELRSEAVARAGGSPVPAWEPPLVEPKEGEFRLLHGHVAVHTHTASQNNPYLHALMPENELWIHPDPAGRLGIRDGDLVEVASVTGSERLRAKVTAGIRPDCVWMAHGFGCLSRAQRRAYGKGANDSGLVPIRVAPISGAAAQCEVVVTVRKVGG